MAEKPRSISEEFDAQLEASRKKLEEAKLKRKGEKAKSQSKSAKTQGGETEAGATISDVGVGQETQSDIPITPDVVAEKKSEELNPSEVLRILKLANKKDISLNEIEDAVGNFLPENNHEKEIISKFLEYQNQNIPILEPREEDASQEVKDMRIAKSRKAGKEFIEKFFGIKKEREFGAGILTPKEEQELVKEKPPEAPFQKVETTESDAPISDPMLRELEKDLEKNPEAEKVEKFLARTENKAQAILTILESGKKINKEDNELIKKYLSGSNKEKGNDKEKFEKEGLTPARTEWLKKQCEAIIDIAETRMNTLRGAILEPEELAALGRKISQEDIRRNIKQNLIEKTQKFNEIAARINKAKSEGRSVSDGVIEYGKRLHDEIEKLGGKKKEKLPVVEAVEVQDKASADETISAGADETQIEKERGKVSEILANDEKKEKPVGTKAKEEINENDMDRKYQSSGFFGKAKIELRDFIEGLKRGDLKQEIKEDVLGVKEGETMRGNFKAAGREVAEIFTKEFWSDVWENRYYVPKEAGREVSQMVSEGWSWLKRGVGKLVGKREKTK